MPYLQYWDVNNLYEWVMSQKLLVFNFEWVEDTLQFNEIFLKNYDWKSEVGYIQGWCLILRKIMWNPQYFAIFTWKKETWKSWKACF